MNMSLVSTVKSGLASANRNNPFWSKRDAMQSFALLHKLNRRNS